MPFLRLGVMVMLLVLGVAGVLIGGVITHSALTQGAITYSGVRDGRPVGATVTRAAEPDRFWRLVALFGLLPLLGGAVAAVGGWRGLMR